MRAVTRTLKHDQLAAGCVSEPDPEPLAGDGVAGSLDDEHPALKAPTELECCLVVQILPGLDGNECLGCGLQPPGDAVLDPAWSSAVR